MYLRERSRMYSSTINIRHDKSPFREVVPKVDSLRRTSTSALAGPRYWNPLEREAGNACVTNNRSA